MNVLSHLVGNIAILAFFFGLTFSKEIANYINAKTESIYAKNRKLENDALNNAYLEGYRDGLRDHLKRRMREYRREDKEELSR